LERSGPSPFGLVVQLQSRDKARVIYDVDGFVDVHLDDKNPYDFEVWRSLGKDVHLTPLPAAEKKNKALSERATDSSNLLIDALDINGEQQLLSEEHLSEEQDASVQDGLLIK
jgi:hypothetical protein